MHFLKRARALVACPGGFGTLDELFETLTLIQTRKINPVPVLLMGSSYWRRVINFEVLVEEGAISEEDLDIFQYVDSAQEAWEVIQAAYGSCPLPGQSHRRISLPKAGARPVQGSRRPGL